MSPDAHDLPETHIAREATIGPYLGHTNVAYFSMEIALRAEMHTYSGGLGVLSGDTARASADLELPMVFVTLLFRKGYLRQEIDASGWQVDHDDPWPPEHFATPLRAKVAVVIEGREVWVRPWLYPLESPVGHTIPILLLDTDLPENRPEDRGITDVLYGGDETYRLKQEIVLGIGGLRLLPALGFQITTYHLNEGHAALLALDLLRRHRRPPDQIASGELAYDVSHVRDACIFTTHTPVEAGHDRFSYELFGHLLQGYIALDQVRHLAGEDRLNMTRLALNLSGYINGVAIRHAETTTRMFPGYDIRAVTNGIHVPTWAHPAFAELFNRHSHEWGYSPEVMVCFDQLPGDDVWRAHQRAKAELVELIERTAGVSFSPELPILGFARRFTAYKRPELLFSDIERLKAIHAVNPFQLVMAGKAHPHDGPAKELIHGIHEVIATLAPAIRIAFLPNYEIGIARTVISGADVWLNTPEPPLEASGTSGMKAAINGVLNLSVPDGWWVEACIEGVTGWTIGDGGGEAHTATAQHLYDKLEQVVLPMYYRDHERWLWMMIQSISKIGCTFNAHRMMRRYAAEAYLAVRPAWRTGHNAQPPS
ncbi:MAG TPA: alpha-glucan family phosphorylase [Rhodanobacter sp.]|nr:alpha-glucan family phosphorylase [Rhodanobacter sp.]